MKYITKFIASAAFSFCNVAAKNLKVTYVTRVLLLLDRAALQHSIHLVNNVLLGASSVPGKVLGIRK